MAQLNEKQKRFCEEYLVDLNTTQAAIRAGYSKKTAYSQGHDLLKKPEVSQYIQALRLEQQKRTGIESDAVVRETAKLAFSDVRGLFNEEGTLLPPSEWPDELAGAIAGIDVVETSTGKGNETTFDYVKKIKLWDKNSALEKLMKHLGAYEKDNIQRNPMLANFESLKPETQDFIVERLRAISMAGGSVASGSEGVTH